MRFGLNLSCQRTKGHKIIPTSITKLILIIVSLSYPLRSIEEGWFINARKINPNFWGTKSIYTAVFNVLIEKLFPNISGFTKTFLAQNLCLQEQSDINSSIFANVFPGRLRCSTEVDETDIRELILATLPSRQRNTRLSWLKWTEPCKWWTASLRKSHQVEPHQPWRG